MVSLGPASLPSFIRSFNAGWAAPHPSSLSRASFGLHVNRPVDNLDPGHCPSLIINLEQDDAPSCIGSLANHAIALFVTFMRPPFVSPHGHRRRIWRAGVGPAHLRQTHTHTQMRGDLASRTSVKCLELVQWGTSPTSPASQPTTGRRFQGPKSRLRHQVAENEHTGSLGSSLGGGRCCGQEKQPIGRSLRF
ncbi:hypothetical protein B0T19DRAFT_400336 [Cercophora scortea]|uniref:Uncharacterized protein n=1 Tax=Cercophora scortea TaxID=314031 RepID=A0AAE0ILU9_9PEZI|nr:hypothetical protein B0T19DRAFT_400336 [Cercophora scortea]